MESIFEEDKSRIGILDRGWYGTDSREEVLELECVTVLLTDIHKQIISTWKIMT